jgi:hypothetical protein
MHLFTRGIVAGFARDIPEGGRASKNDQSKGAKTRATQRFAGSVRSRTATVNRLAKLFHIPSSVSLDFLSFNS